VDKWLYNILLKKDMNCYCVFEEKMPTYKNNYNTWSFGYEVINYNDDIDTIMTSDY
jgi:hypothetical protein